MNQTIKSYICLSQTLQHYLEINHVAYAITPWHAIGVDAAIRYLTDNGCPEGGVSVVLRHAKTGFCCRTDTFTNDDAYKFCLEGYVSSSKIRTILDYSSRILILVRNFFRRKKKNFYIVGPWLEIPLTRLLLKKFFNRHIKLIVIDEGVAQYMGTLQNESPQNSLKKRGRQFFIYMGNTFIANHFDSIDFRLMKKKNNQLFVNEIALPYYQDVLRILSKKINFNYLSEPLDNTFVICTTAWDRKQIQDNEDLNLLKRICAHLHDKGYRLLLKTHPRDSFFSNFTDDLHCSLLDCGSIAMEVLCEKYRFRGIISFSSTILITASVLFNIPTYCISDMLNRNKIGGTYLKEIDAFKNTFGQMITFVKNEDNVTW